MTTGRGPSAEELKELERLLSEDVSGMPSKTYADLLRSGVPHKGGLAQLAEALPELLGFTTEKPPANGRAPLSGDGPSKPSDAEG